jgi:hypothetical protein
MRIEIEFPATWATPGAVWDFGCDGYTASCWADVPDTWEDEGLEIEDYLDKHPEYWLAQNQRRFMEVKGEKTN